MQAHMKRLHTKRNHILYLHSGTKTYAIPVSVANKYLVDEGSTGDSIPASDLFADLDQERTKAGALLKGLRARENMNQTAFAKAIAVTQANLSKMEHGKRPIGKQIAKRIEQVFGDHYKYFLE